MNIKFEGAKINDLARKFLRRNDTKEKVDLGKLRMALLTVFVPKHKDKISDAKAFREYVIHTSKTKPVNYLVIPGKENSIYNALCLIYLIGAGDTRLLFQSYYKYQKLNRVCDTSKLEEQTERQYLEFFCLGIVRERIDEIVESIHSDSFDLFTDKLPSPFSNNSEDNHNISPLMSLFDKPIPWKDYMEQFQIAEELFFNKKHPQAREALKSLDNQALLRLPVVESLNRKIEAEEKENKEAWDYVQNILN